MKLQIENLGYIQKAEIGMRPLSIKYVPRKKFIFKNYLIKDGVKC
jgi:hypothetical protein